jgi:hypothetical protein
MAATASRRKQVLAGPEVAHVELDPVSRDTPRSSAWENAALPRMALDMVPRPELDKKLSGAPAAPCASAYTADVDDDVFCLFLQKQQPTDKYPLDTFPRGLKKAHLMMLPSCPLWYYNDPFIPLVDVVVR